MQKDNIVSKGRLTAMIDDALRGKGRQPEEKLFKEIGTALISMGVEAETDPGSAYYLKPVSAVDFKAHAPLEAMEMHFNVMTDAVREEDAEKKGKDFWRVFRKKAIEHMCADEKIKKLLKEAKVKDALLVALPLVLTSMGLIALWVPVVAVIVTGLIMLLLNAGLDSVCEVYA